MTQDSITNAQMIIFTSTTPDQITAYLDKRFPGVTDRVSRGDLRAIVLSSTALALKATAARLIDEQMAEVEEAWDDPLDNLRAALKRALETDAPEEGFALAEDEEE